VRLGLDNQTGRMKGFAYVEFMRTESVDKAVEMNGKIVGGRKIMVVRDPADLWLQTPEREITFFCFFVT